MQHIQNFLIGTIPITKKDKKVFTKLYSRSLGVFQSCIMGKEKGLVI